MQQKHIRLLTEDKWNLHTKQCGRLTLYRQSDGQTDRIMKTAGPIHVTTPSIDLELPKN